jgi:hypothetical protein
MVVMRPRRRDCRIDVDGRESNLRDWIDAVERAQGRVLNQS